MPEKSFDNPSKIKLTEDRENGLLRSFIAFYSAEFDEELSQFRAEQIFDFFIKALGPAVYNQAIQDARAFMMEKLEDLDADFYFDDSNDM
jgi:uncharacterized protein (DUF2164 family)